MAISDNDANFDDNDGNQVLDGAQQIDGVTYAGGTRVEAEYGVVVTDGTRSWTLVGFNVNNSNPTFGTIEGLAFIGGSGGFPPVGVPLTVTGTFEGPAYLATEYATPICLVAGTRVTTATGPRPIEQLGPGDLVLTRDNGLQPVRWAGQRRVPALAAFAPVRIRRGTLGNRRDLWVSQQHRVLVEGWKAELLFGEAEVLVAAVHLVNDGSIRLMPGGEVCYVHLLFDRHEVIETEGCWTESLFTGSTALASLPPAAHAEILALFPELAGPEAAHRTTSYRVLKRHEARILGPDPQVRA
ncbi:hypothetical protein BOO69_14830 [Sulfitobacter alexandrii]|uniref:Hedgehog/Intein (Hint) domain-containing protein n=1 Tax=Sulfitobacter alexandrii TaxID=1917485 RepID=A0A1J0WMV6_9RHOB|nr:hypothetical protein BOO69_14830 [Sulfitobacter alexandrii]